MKKRREIMNIKWKYVWEWKGEKVNRGMNRWGKEGKKYKENEKTKTQ